MSYTPKTWQCGEKITAEALNRLEQSVASASGGDTIIFTIEERPATAEECPNQEVQSSVYTYSHSWQELHDALSQDKRVIYKRMSDEDGVMIGIITTVLHDSSYLAYALVASPSEMYTGNYPIIFADSTSKTRVNC